jgi:putative ABC transport system permease protein
MTSLQLAILNLWRRKVPTVVVLLAIAVAVGCSGLLLRLYVLSNSRFGSLARGGDAIVGAKAGGLDILLGSLNLEGSYPGYLPGKLFESLRARSPVHFEDGVKADPDYIASAIPFLYAGVAENFRVIGTDDSFLRRPIPEDSLRVEQGTWFAAPLDVVLGAQVARSLRLKVGDTLNIRSWSSGTTQEARGELQPFHIVGILASSETAWDRAVYVSLSDARQLLVPADLERSSIWRNDVLNYFLIYLRPGGFAALDALVNRRTVGQVIDVREQIRKLEELTGVGRRLGLFISAFVMLLGGLAVAGMMITRFDGMSTQVAVLRAIGYDRKRITQWLLWEGFLLGVLAVLIGAVFDLSLFPLVRSLLGSTVPEVAEVPVSLASSLPVWIIAILCTTAAVAMPVIRLSRQDVHNSLRGV